MQTINPHSASDRYQLMIASALGAVAEHFSHIALRDIITPPGRSYSDAYLARQIAWIILVRELGIPKKRLEKLLPPAQDTLRRAERIVSDRRRCPVFNRKYENMAARAVALMRAEIEAAA